jgi:ketosteroid isomerase-like protein
MSKEKLQTSKMNNIRKLLLLAGVTISLCVMTSSSSYAQAANKAPSVNPGYEIASPEYSKLAAEALTYLTGLDIDKWVSLMSDDVEFAFPDGDEGTRTKLTGKKAVADWWNNWKKTSGVKSMTFEKHVEIAVNSLDVNPSTGLAGVSVISYFSNNMNINGSPVRLRMNFTAHFNKDKKIDRYFTYYDRTKIVQAMGKNILEKKN